MLIYQITRLSIDYPLTIDYPYTNCGQTDHFDPCSRGASQPIHFDSGLTEYAIRSSMKDGRHDAVGGAIVKICYIYIYTLIYNDIYIYIYS